MHLKKGDLLLTPDTFANNQYYVYSGCLRSYFINAAGKDHTTQFAIKDWWISDYTAFFTTEKAVMNIECLQDAVVYKFSRENMNHLCEEMPKVEIFFRNHLKGVVALETNVLMQLMNSVHEGVQASDPTLISLCANAIDHFATFCFENSGKDKVEVHNLNKVSFFILVFSINENSALTGIF